MLRISMSIVVYKPDLEVLDRTLRSVHQAIKTAEQVLALDSVLYVVDNSCERSWPNLIEGVLRESFPQDIGLRAEFIISSENGGYGKGNNLALTRVESAYHLVMNPDVYLDSDAIVTAISYMERDKSVGLLVPDVRGEDGARHFLCKRNPSLLIMFLRGFAPRWLKHVFRKTLYQFEMRDKDYERDIDGVEYPTGCFMFFRSDVFQKLEGFDPDFFMYFEDADIGRRVLAIAKVRYVPAVRIIHRWARGTHNNWRLRWATIKSALIYWRKWGGVY